MRAKAWPGYWTAPATRIPPKNASSKSGINSEMGDDE